MFEVPRGPRPLEQLVQPTRIVAKAHDAPVHVCKTDPTSTYLASGSADGIVKVWDIVRGYVTHVFKGHGGVVSALAFNYPRDASSALQNQKMHLITGSVDTRIRIFDLSSPASRSKPDAVLEGHVSVPRGFDVSLDGKWLVSGGRDSVVLIWDLSPLQSAKVNKNNDSKGKGKERITSPKLCKTIPILERVEAVGLLRFEGHVGSTHDQIMLYTGGEKGVVKIWDGFDGKVLFTLGQPRGRVTEDSEEQRQIMDVLYVCLLFDECFTSISQPFADMCLPYPVLCLFMLTRTSFSTRYLPRL